MIGKILLLSFISPFKESSPKIWISSNTIFLSSYNEIKRAIGKSKWVPVFFISLGARLIVIFLGGNLYSFVSNADFTLSFDSFIWSEGNPTIVKLGSPFVNV